MVPGWLCDACVSVWCDCTQRNPYFFLTRLVLADLGLIRMPDCWAIDQKIFRNIAAEKKRKTHVIMLIQTLYASFNSARCARFADVARGVSVDG